MNHILDNLLALGILLLALIVLYAASTFLWNRKYLPAMLAKGKLKKPLNTILKEINQFTFKEDNGSLLKKASPKTKKIFSNRNLHLAIALLGPAIFILTGNWYALLLPPLSFAIGVSRALPILQKRTQTLDRIFQIASSSIKFTAGPRAKNAPPPASWQHITVEKWEKDTPHKMVITFPSGNGPEQQSQKSFQKSFELNVTDQNIWNFEWDLPHDRVTIEAAPLLPTQLLYPGSKDAPWSVFPVGESSKGVASYDVSTFPHVLVAGPSGTGKMTSLITDVNTLNKGWVTIGDLEVGDIVFGVDGKPTKVTHLHPIVTPDTAYKMTFGNGESVIVDADHLWETETANARASRSQGAKETVRKPRFADEVVKAVEAELANTKDSDTISVPELAALLNVSPEGNFIHWLAKRVGPAEEIHPTHVFHYNSQIVKQNQIVTRLDFREFVNWYNNRKETAPTKKFPLLRGHFDKMNQLAHEVRDSDMLTVESVLEYLDAWQKVSADWIRSNIDTSLVAPVMVKDLREKAEGKFNVLPAQILVPVEDQNGMLSKQDVAALLGLPLDDVQSLWTTARRVVKTKTMQSELVELRVSEKTVSRKAPSYFTYPKKLILENALAENIILNDQRDKISAAFNVVTTQEIFETLKTRSGSSNHFVRKARALELPEASLPVAPYVMGAWLGDGYSKAGSICGLDHEVFDRCVELGYEYSSHSWEKRDERKHADYRSLNFPRLHSELKMNGYLLSQGKTVSKDGEVKHIPAAYFASSVEQRRELLRGLLDTDGTVAKNSAAIEFASSNKVLAKDVKRLVASLGYIPYFRSKVPTYSHKGEKFSGKRAYTVSFQADPADRVFGLSRKNAAHVKAFRGDRLDHRAHSIVSVERVESVPMRCISVDASDRLFLVSDSLIPTHNSVLQRNIVFHTIQHNDRWRFLGIDIKRVELTPYNKYKKTVMGIATDVEQGLAVLKYAYNEMMERYEMMEKVGVNNVMDMEDPPYGILLMIDEATMFLGTSGSKTEEGKAEDAMKGEASDLVGKILRLGRASGVHMLIAMQRPDATVLRGEFKANMDVRLAAGRMDSTPSAMVLDSGEAVNLPGIKGRGLIRVGGDLTVFQGYFAPQDWIDTFILENPEAEPSCIAPGGHLHDKFMATKRLAAKKETEPEAEETSQEKPADKKKGLKGLGKKKKQEESQPVPAPAPAEAPAPVEAQPEFDEDEDYQPVPLSNGIDLDFGSEFGTDDPVTESHQALMDSLQKRADAPVDGTSGFEVPDFFTGAASKTPSKSAATVEPDLELSDEDFLLDDDLFMDDTEGVDDTNVPDITKPAPVAGKWVSASPFGEEDDEEGGAAPVAPPAPAPRAAPAAPARPLPPRPAPGAPARPLPPRPASPGTAQPAAPAPARPSLPVRPNSPFLPNSNSGAPQRPFPPSR